MLSLVLLGPMVVNPFGAPESPLCRLANRDFIGYDATLNLGSTVRIVQGNWAEARLVPHVAGVLIRDKLGLNVEYVLDRVDGTNGTCIVPEDNTTSWPKGCEEVKSGRMYDMLASGEADLALTLWPAKFTNTNRAEALNSECPKSTTSRCMSTVGNQGYQGRSGWFVPNVSSVRDAPAAWAAITTFYGRGYADAPDYIKELKKSHELPVVNRCDIKTYPGRYGGTYNCSDGSWILDDSTCCPRAHYSHLLDQESMDVELWTVDYNTSCEGRPPCVALIVDDPTYDSGLNEGIVARLAQQPTDSGIMPPGIQIVYGNVEKEVDKAEEQDRPVVAYSWLPRGGTLMRRGRFVRITLESFFHCERDNVFSKFLDVTACDFPVENVEKGVVWKQQQPASSNAALFVDNFNLNATQLLDLLERAANISSNAAVAELDRIACDWLNENEKIWQKWLPDDAIRSTWLAQWRAWLIVCGLCFFWVFWVEPNVLRCGDFDAGVNEACRGSSKGTTTFGMDCFGLLYRISRRHRERARKKRETNVHAVRVSAAQLEESIADESVAQVSFGHTQMLVRKFEHVVELVILRLDTLPESIDVTVSAIDASAVFGAHHSGFSELSSENGSTRAGRGVRSLTITFGPLERTRLVLLHIHDSAHAYSGLCRFSATLSVASHGSIRGIVAPVKLTRVTLIETTHFPNGLLSEGLSPDASLDGSFSALTPATATNVDHGPLDRLSQPARFSLIRRARSLLRKNSERDVGNPDAELQGALWSWRPVYHYLAEASRWCLAEELGGFRVPKPVKFALGQVCVQAINGFLQFLLFKSWYSDGLGQLRLEVSISCAALSLISALVNWRVGLFSSGAWAVQRQLQVLLLRKYLSMDELDLKAHGGHLEDQFRQAITSTASQLSSDCYLAAHLALSSLWGVVFAIAFLLYQSRESGLTGPTNTGTLSSTIVGMLLGTIAIFVFRAPKTWRYWKINFLNSIQQSTTLSHLLAKPMLVRSAKLEDKAASITETQITGNLWTNFDHWNHRYTSEWIMRGFMLVIVYSLWASGPLFTDPRLSNFSTGDNSVSLSFFLTVLLVLNNIGESLISFEQHVTTMFTSGSMVTVVADLLNYPTRAYRMLDEVPELSSNYRDHPSGARASSVINTARDEDECEELRGIMTSHATAAYALTLKDVCLYSLHNRPLFECLNLYQRQSPDGLLLRITEAMVPAGGIIGVRKSSGLDSDIDWLLLQLLGGWMLPDSGVARVLPSLHVELVRGVNVAEALFRGSLRDNLTYGVAWPVDDTELWELCRRCGLSEHMIGEDNVPGWAVRTPFDPVVIKSHYTLSDNGTILVVRALLRKPDVLLLHNVGEQWETARQAHLIGAVRAYLDKTLPLPGEDKDKARSLRGDGVALERGEPAAPGELSDHGSRATNERRRTVLWAASDPLLISAMKREMPNVPRLADRLITLESNSVAALAAPDEVFPEVDLDGTRESATKALGAFQRISNSSKERVSKRNSTVASAALAEPTAGAKNKELALNAHTVGDLEERMQHSTAAEEATAHPSEAKSMAEERMRQLEALIEAQRVELLRNSEELLRLRGESAEEPASAASLLGGAWTSSHESSQLGVTPELSAVAETSE